MTRVEKVGFGSDLKKKLKEWGFVVLLQLLRWLLERITSRNPEPGGDGADRKQD